MKQAPEEKPTITVIKKEYLMPSGEKPKVSTVPISSQDILNMDIVFADGLPTENTDSCIEQSQVAIPTSNEDDTVMSSDSSFIFLDCQPPPIGNTKVKLEVTDDDKDYADLDNEESNVEGDQEGYDSNNESVDSLSMKELAVVASHSVDDPNNVIYEVYAVSAITGELSDKPLDLPPDVVEQIRISIGD